VRETAGRPNRSGRTALCHAVHAGDTEVVDALLACEQVRKAANAASVVTGHTALMDAAQNKDTRTLKALLTCEDVCRGAGLHCLREYGSKTALMLCVSVIPYLLGKAALLESVEALLACPQVVQTSGDTDSRGDTALALAVQARFDEEDLEAHKTLIRRLCACAPVAATARVANHAGRTALDYAAHPEIAACLRSALQ